MLQLPLDVQVYESTFNFAKSEEMESELVQWRALRDLKEAEEDMEQEEGGILSHQNLLPLADLVQTVTEGGRK